MKKLFNKSTNIRGCKVKVLTIILICFLIVSMGILFIKLRYPIQHKEIVQQYSKEYRLEPALVFAVIHAESKFKVDAASPKDALGLMQMTKATGEWVASMLKVEPFKYDDLFDPALNIRFGCWYLRYNLDYFDEDIELALAAYNAGRGNVTKWLENKAYSQDGKTLDSIPFKETKDYIRRVNVNYRIYALLEELNVY